MPDQNRFLNGPFAPVAEETTAFDLPVTATRPAGLNGRYPRNGPNPLGLDDPALQLAIKAGVGHLLSLCDHAL